MPAERLSFWQRLLHRFQYCYGDDGDAEGQIYCRKCGRFLYG